MPSLYRSFYYGDMAKVLSPILEDCCGETSSLDAARFLHRSDLSNKGFRYYALSNEGLPKECIESARGAIAKRLSCPNDRNNNLFLSQRPRCSTSRRNSFQEAKLGSKQILCDVDGQDKPSSPMFSISLGYIAEVATKAAIRSPEVMGQITVWVRMALCGVLLQAATLLSLMAVGLWFAAHLTLKPSGVTDRKRSLDQEELRGLGTGFARVRR